MGWATFWEIFSQTHLVALFPTFVFHCHFLPFAFYSTDL
jgi:hypothetical protein